VPSAQANRGPVSLHRFVDRIALAGWSQSETSFNELAEDRPFGYCRLWPSLGGPERQLPGRESIGTLPWSYDSFWLL
jgi:hypothetical protein